MMFRVYRKEELKLLLICFEEAFSREELTSIKGRELLMILVNDVHSLPSTFFHSYLLTQ